MNMKTTLILAVMAVGVAIIALTQLPRADEDTAAGEGGQADDTKKVVELKSDQVTRVELETRYGGKMVFVREDDSWTMLEPVKARATKYQVDSIVRTVTDLEYATSYEAGDASRPENTGFDAPFARVVLHAEGDKKVDLVIGSNVPLGKGRYLRKGSDETILVSQEDLSQEFNKRPRDFRDKQLVKREAQDVARIRVEGAANFEIVRDGQDWVIEKPYKMKADRARADRIARKVCGIYASDWIEDEPSSYAIYGLEEPRLRVTAVLEHEVAVERPAEDAASDEEDGDEEPATEIREETLVLLVGGATDHDAKSFFARFEGLGIPWVFSISDHDRKELAPSLTELADKQVIDVEPSRVTKIEARLPDGLLALTKEQGNWYFSDEGETPADMTAVQDLLRSINSLKAESFADPEDPLTQHDWDNPRARIAVTQEGKVEPAVLLVGNASASGRMVYVRNAANVAVAAVRESEVENIMLGPIAYRDRSIMNFPRDRVSRLEIARRGSEQVVLEQLNNVWKLVEPIEAPADASAVRRLLIDLATLRAQRVVSVGDKGEYGLDDPDVRLAVQLTPLADDPDTTVVGEDTEEQASPSDEERAAEQAEGAPEAQPAEAMVDSDAPGMSLEELLEFQKSLPATATRPGDVVENPLATQMLEEMIARKGATQPAGGEAKKEPAYTLEELLEYQKSLPLTATQPGDIVQNPLMTELLEKLVAEQKAEAEAAESAGQVAASAEKAGSDVGKKASSPMMYRLAIARHEGKVYAALARSETVYELSTTQLDNAMAELHDRQIARFEVSEVKEIAFTHNGRQATLSRVDTSSWKALEDPVLPIDHQKVTEVLNDLRDLKTHRYVAYDSDDPGRYQFDGEGADRLTITLQDGSRISIVLSPAGPEDDPDASRYATLEDTGKVFLLKGEQAENFAKTLMDFEKEESRSAA